MSEAMYVLIGLHIDGLRDLFDAVAGNGGDLWCRDRLLAKRLLAEMWPTSIGSLAVLSRALDGEEMDFATASVRLASLIAPPGCPPRPRARREAGKPETAAIRRLTALCNKLRVAISG